EANHLEILYKYARTEIEHMLNFGRTSGVLDTGVDDFHILAEDHHLHILGSFHRAAHAPKPAYRPQADVEVEHLPQRHVQGADAAAHRRGQRALDADEKAPERVDRLVGQPVVEEVLRLLARVD